MSTWLSRQAWLTFCVRPARHTHTAAQNFVDYYYDALNRRNGLAPFYASTSNKLTAAAVKPDISINGNVCETVADFEHLLNTQGNPVHWYVVMACTVLYCTSSLFSPSPFICLDRALLREKRKILTLYDLVRALYYVLYSPLTRCLPPMLLLPRILQTLPSSLLTLAPFSLPPTNNPAPQKQNRRRRLLRRTTREPEFCPRRAPIIIRDYRS